MLYLILYYFDIISERNFIKGFLYITKMFRSVSKYINSKILLMIDYL